MTDRVPLRAFRLQCTDCDFETVVDGTGVDAFETARGHRERYETLFDAHVVEFEPHDDWRDAAAPQRASRTFDRHATD